MLKNASKLFGLFILLVLSFVYTDKVFSSARASDPIMKEVMNYKKKNDVKPLEPVISGDEMVLGVSGLLVNEKESYSNMKEDGKFDEEKIVYDTKLPKTSISKTYDYYVKKGNTSKEYVSLIFKVEDNNNLTDIVKVASNYDVNVTFFVDGAWLEENTNEVFDLVEHGYEVYNLGYNGKYDKDFINQTNKILESITLLDSKYCLNEDKNDDYKEICKKKKMISLAPGIVDPSLSELKSSLAKGEMIVYDAKNFDASLLGMIDKSITSKGYEIVPLSKLIKE